MADLTNAGRPAEERSAKLKRRRLELQLDITKTDVKKHEFRILELEEEILKTREIIEHQKTQIHQIQESLKSIEQGENS